MDIREVFLINALRKISNSHSQNAKNRHTGTPRGYQPGLLPQLDMDEVDRRFSEFKRYHKITVRKRTFSYQDGGFMLRPYHVKRAAQLMQNGVSDSKLAQALNIPPRTISTYRQRYRRIMEAIDRGGRVEIDEREELILYFGFVTSEAVMLDLVETSNALSYAVHVTADTKAIIYKHQITDKRYTRLNQIQTRTEGATVHRLESAAEATLNLTTDETKDEE